MRTSRLMIAAAILAFILPTHPAKPGVGDPLISLYFFPGVRDNGGAALTGVATSVHCSNFSGQTEKIEYSVTNFDASVKAFLSLNIGQFQTRTASTHDTLLYAEDLLLNTGTVDQGALLIVTTSLYIVCTAQVLDASASIPNGIDLHGIRFQVIPGTAE